MPVARTGPVVIYRFRASAVNCGKLEVTAFVGSLDQLADKTVLDDHTSLVALWT